jgi:hypothetical protein
VPLGLATGHQGWQREGNGEMPKKYEEEIVEILDRMERSERREAEKRRKRAQRPPQKSRLQAKVGPANFAGLVLLGSAFAAAIAANFIRPNLPLVAFYLGVASMALLVSPIVASLVSGLARPRESRWRGNVINTHGRRPVGDLRYDWRRAWLRFKNTGGRGPKKWK